MGEGFWMNLQEPFFILHTYYSLFCSENQVLFQLFLFFFLYSLSLSYIHIIVTVSKKIKLFFRDF
nr:MAG TPA: hypothetical protein [Caudoviricetes sp.]